jgi:glycine hydroxymethyltransferase
MVDMAHFAGLVAGNVFRDQYNPIPYADVVSSTTHKTLRGPRGGLVLCRSEFAEFVDRGCPLILGGPLPHVVAAKAVCFAEALSDSFRTYARQVVDNAAALASALTASGVPLVSGGTDNHLVLADVRGLGLTGRQAEDALRSCGVTLNRNVIPNDTNSPLVTSGLRLGTAAVTTLGMGVAEMKEIADIVVTVLRATRPGTGADGRVSKIQYETPDDVRVESRRHVRRLLDAHPLYPRLKSDVLRESLSASAAASRG